MSDEPPIWPRILLLSGLVAVPVVLVACSPKEGSPEWCELMKNKPRGDWTVHQEEIYGDKCASNELQRQLNRLLKNR